jgi:hypothetical protein
VSQLLLYMKKDAFILAIKSCSQLRNLLMTEVKILANRNGHCQMKVCEVPSVNPIFTNVSDAFFLA